MLEHLFRTRTFQSFYERMSGKGASDSEAHPAVRTPPEMLSAGSRTIGPIFGVGQTPGHLRIALHSEGAAMHAAGQASGASKSWVVASLRHPQHALPPSRDWLSCSKHSGGGDVQLNGGGGGGGDGAGGGDGLPSTRRTIFPMARMCGADCCT